MTPVDYVNITCPSTMELEAPFNDCMSYHILPVCRLSGFISQCLFLLCYVDQRAKLASIYIYMYIFWNKNKVDLLYIFFKPYLLGVHVDRVDLPKMLLILLQNKS